MERTNNAPLICAQCGARVKAESVESVERKWIRVLRGVCPRCGWLAWDIRVRE